MVRNQEKYEQAVQFRARGFTLAEIAKICDVSKSTVSKWLKNNAISADVTKQNKRRAGLENAKRLRLIQKTRSRERSLRHAEIERSAATEFKHYKKDPLFLSALMIYACAGDLKDPQRIRLSSAKMNMHQLFIRFSLSYLGVTKTDIKLWLQLYAGHNEETCLKRWKRKTGLPYSQFGKTQWIKGDVPRKTLHSGVGNTIIGSTVLKRKLTEWVRLAEKELTK